MLKSIFIEKARKIHGDKYDYSNIPEILLTHKQKIDIFCKKHNATYKQLPHNHLQGQKCPKCAFEDRLKKRRYSAEQFIEKARKIHGDKYDYSETEYINERIKVKIICNNCKKVFLQSPALHLNKRGCPFCRYDKVAKKLSVIKKSNTYEFIEKAKKIHGDKYDYSETEYTGAFNYIKFKCNCCDNVNTVKACNHLQGQGCSFCTKSEGEKTIESYLSHNNIIYVHNKEFKNLKDKKRLSYDFYIPEKNILIEFNGQQHYKFCKWFYKTPHDFHRQLHHDWLKRKYAKDNNIKLLTISFRDFKNIKTILEEELKELINGKSIFNTIP